MATPFGHALAGYAVFNASGSTRTRHRLELAVLCLAMGLAPDLDMIPGFLIGKPVFFHGTISHSIGFALMVSLAIATIYHFRGKSFSLVVKLCFFSYLTHLILDFFNPDGRPPYGIPFFWPFCGEYFLSPIPLLLGTRHVSSTTASTLEFFGGVMSLYNIVAILLEVVILLPFILWSRPYRNWQNFPKLVGNDEH